MAKFSAYFSKLTHRVLLYDRARRELQGLSSEILAGSKRVIFALQREDEQTAHKELEIAHKFIQKALRLIRKDPRLNGEGAWRAAQEEFCEAALLDQYTRTRSLDRVAVISDDPEIFLGALSDLSGELVRVAIRLASRREQNRVEKIFQDVEQIVEYLLKMNLTGSLRTKVDQARQNLRKLEEIRYDLTLRS